MACNQVLLQVQLLFVYCRLHVKHVVYFSLLYISKSFFFSAYCMNVIPLLPLLISFNTVPLHCTLYSPPARGYCTIIAISVKEPPSGGRLSRNGLMSLYSK